ncbi:MAG TPA: Rrf2 family transcriptional regulator [Patescibacteria group bacterium]|nr:Rrf2 family transcriptional regulator [Patescibacteria group bacterium]
MLKLSRRVDLGILLLTDLARLNTGQSLSLSTWAQTKQLPYRFLTKIALNLKQAKLITSKEGRTGGYRLAKGIGQISLGEVIVRLEGKTSPVACLRGEACVAFPYCRHKKVIGGLAALVDKYLAKVTLQDLC